MATTTVLWHMSITAGKEAEFEGLARQLVAGVHANEPGQVFEYRRTKEGPQQYVLFLSFDSDIAYGRYSQADYHRAVSPKMMELMAAPPVAEHLETF